jgi:hypothetical protein
MVTNDPAQSLKATFFTFDHEVVVVEVVVVEVVVELEVVVVEVDDELEVDVRLAVELLPMNFRH